jgi:VWFA-related protein
MLTRRAFTTLLGGGVAGSLLAQEATFGVDVQVVDVYATVRDRDGRIVSDLNQEDFILEENGKRQEIKYFARRSEIPLKLGLLVDTSLSQRRLIETQRHAAAQFLQQVLRPEQDLACIIKFDREVELLQDLTGSREALERSLAYLNVQGSTRRPPQRPRRSNFQGERGQTALSTSDGRLKVADENVSGQSSLSPFQWPGGGFPWPGTQGPGGWPGGSRTPMPRRWPDRARMVGTAMYDAIFLAADEVLYEQSGRKAMILITDGVDAGSKVSRDEAIEFAQRADAIVYSIRYFDSEAYPQRGMGRQMAKEGDKALKSISEETGGRMFEVSGELTLDRVFALIQEELRNQYSIGYTPANSEGRGFRKIELRTANKKLKVQARPGYYPKGDSKAG